MMNPIWASRVGTIVLVGGVLLVSIGLWVTPAAAPPRVKEDPFAGVTKNWDKNLPSDSRFTVLTDFGGAAVRDNNTGLVWEQAPDSTAAIQWAPALSYCINKNVGGTRGWRLPSVAELASLIDPSLAPPFVPASVFTNVQTSNYWSATTRADSPTFAWNVRLTDAVVHEFLAKGSTLYVWCVRGPMNADTY